MNGQYEHSAYDVCIIGAGIAGASMAAVLGTKGFKVLIVEKTFSDQDRIVGELLQPGGVVLFEKMGLSEALKGIEAQSINGYGLFLENRRFNVPYPDNKGKAFTGRGFRYEKLLDNLRDLIKKEENVTVLEGLVTAMIETRDDEVKGIRIMPNGGTEEIEINVPLTIMSDGCFSSFRKNYIRTNSKITGYFIGLLLENCQLPYPNHGHVILADPSPFLAYPVNNVGIRMLIDYPYDKVPRLGKKLEEYLLEVIGPQVPEELYAAYAKAIEGNNIKVMPNHLLPAMPKPHKGVAILGDALNMRHPLTGGGMTVALTDVHYLSQKLITQQDLDDKKAVSMVIQKHYAERSSQTATINILADALYQVFRHPDLKVACFDYLQRGPQYYADPVALLAGISRDRTTLIRHFAAVAQFGAMRTMKQESFPDNIRKAYRMIQAASNIITPLLENEKPGPIVKTVLRGSKMIFGE